MWGILPSRRRCVHVDATHSLNGGKKHLAANDRRHISVCGCSGLPRVCAYACAQSGQHLHCAQAKSRGRAAGRPAPHEKEGAGKRAASPALAVKVRD
jgi:hypothetical protein